MSKPPSTFHLPPSTPGLRVALVCDWMIGGGAEQVVEQLAAIFPDAPIYTSVAARQWRERLDGRIITGWLDRWPLPALRKFIPFLRIWWFSRLKLDDYDLVISSSGAEAKGIKVGRSKIEDRRWQKSKPPTSNFQLPTSKPLHVAYVHAPTHYYWDRYEAYLKEPGFGWFNWAARLGLRILVGPLRRWDFRAAQRPDQLIANSTPTQKMIKKYYGRDSTVIFPPVDVAKFHLPPSTFHNKSRKGFIVVGRQTPYKRIDLAVAACTKLKLPLTVVGDGPEHKKLLKMAGPSILFLTGVSEDEKIALLQRHAGFIFPNEDDFGIAPVEAMAAGCPVIALRAGGALDTVRENVSGTFFDEPTVSSLVSALKKFHPRKFNNAKVSNQASQFSSEKFRQHLHKFLKSFVSIYFTHSR